MAPSKFVDRPATPGAGIVSLVARRWSASARAAFEPITNECARVNSSIGGQVQKNGRCFSQSMRLVGALLYSQLLKFYVEFETFSLMSSAACTGPRTLKPIPSESLIRSCVQPTQIPKFLRAVIIADTKITGLPHLFFSPVASRPRKPYGTSPRDPLACLPAPGSRHCARSLHDGHSRQEYTSLRESSTAVPEQKHGGGGRSILYATRVGEHEPNTNKHVGFGPCFIEVTRLWHIWQCGACARGGVRGELSTTLLRDKEEADCSDPAQNKWCQEPKPTLLSPCTEHFRQRFISAED